jgi:hypothetical protein
VYVFIFTLMADICTKELALNWVQLGQSRIKPEKQKNNPPNKATNQNTGFFWFGSFSSQ